MCGTSSTHGRNEKLMDIFFPPKRTKRGVYLVDVVVDVRITLNVWVEFLVDYDMGLCGSVQDTENGNSPAI
jgi:hypothetical protein